MSAATGQTIDPQYFRELYRRNEDPWSFATSEYEHEKYRATLQALGKRRYRNALELGCSIGVFTSLLAPRCDRLLAVDVSPHALERARARCMAFPGVHFAEVDLRHEFPEGAYDLVALCELGYYFARDDLARIRDRIVAALESAGTLLLVHWLPPVAGHAMRTEAVHDLFGETTALEHVIGRRTDTYLLDIFSRP